MQHRGKGYEAVPDFKLDFLEPKEQELVLKMLQAVVEFDDVHINRFTIRRRDGKWEYFVGQRAANSPTPFPQYTALERNITDQLRYYGIVRNATARGAPSGWFEFTDEALDWYRSRSTPHGSEEDSMSSTSGPDVKTVFVVHGRNRDARRAMFQFLRSLDLNPLEWSHALELTGEGAPYIGQVLDQAFDAAQAVVVLLTPDDIAYLRPEYGAPDDPEREPKGQARPNVLFEAGMAFGRNPRRTILVELGDLRPFSDVAGRHVVRMDNSPEKRMELARRLGTAGCKVDTSGTDWMSEGDLRPPAPPGGGLPLGRRLPTDRPASVRLDARYVERGKRSVLQITNYSSVDIYDLTFEIPEEAGGSFHVHAELPLKKLPPGATASFPAIRFLGDGSDHFEITISGRTPDGETISVPAFISLAG